MSRQVTVLVGDKKAAAEKFVRAMSRHSRDVYAIRSYDDIAVIIKQGVVRCIYLEDGTDVALADLVYLRGITHEYLRHALAIYLQYRKVPVVNSESQFFQCRTKLEQCVTLALADISVPDSVFVTRPEDYSRAMRLLGCSFPIVAKSIVGSNGRQNMLVRSREERKASTIDQPIFQAFIPNEFDYRVIVVGDKVALAFKRIRQPKTHEHRNNLALGARREIVKLSKDLQYMAVAAANAVGREFSGVDIVTDSTTGRSVILEVNFNFATPIFGSAESSIENDYYEKVSAYFTRLMD